MIPLAKGYLRQVEEFISKSAKIAEAIMKNSGFIIGIFFIFILSNIAVYGETIYTKDGKTIKAENVSTTVDTIWYELQGGKVGISKDRVEKILNDEGLISQHSPNFEKTNVDFKKKSQANNLPDIKYDESLYIKALELAAEGKYNESSKEFNEVLKINKYNNYAKDAIKIINDLNKGVIKEETASCLFRGLKHFMVGHEYSQAIPLLEKALEANPDYAYSYDIYGTVIFTSYGMGQPAIPYFKKALELDSNNPYFYEDIGITYFFSQQYDKAKDNLDKAKKMFEIDNNTQELELIKGFLRKIETELQPKGSSEATVESNSQKVNEPKGLDLSNAEKYYNEGIISGKKGNLNEAISRFDKAIEINPNYVEAYNMRARTYWLLGWHDQALADYNKAIEIKPNYAEAYNNMGAVYAALGMRKEALNSYNKAIELKKDYADPYNNIGALYFSLGDYQQAIDNYKKALEVDPKNIEANYNLGNVYGFKKDYEQAIFYYQKVVEIDPSHAKSYANLGIMYNSRGQTEQAIINFQKAKEIFVEQNDYQNAKKVESRLYNLKGN